MPSFRFVTATAAAAAMLLCSALARAADDGISDSEIRIGMVNVQSGPAAGLGKGMLEGALAVFKDVNAKGGVHGRKINLVVADDGYEPNRAVDETLKMIEQEKVFSLFGYVGTPTANAVLPIVKEMDVPLVGAFTGAMTLRQPVTKQLFNVRASYDDEAETLVAHFIEKGAKSVAVFYQDDGFGTAVLSGTEKALKKRGLAVAAKGTFQRNTLAIKTGLAAMLDAKPDAVVMVGPYAPLAAFIKEARGAGLKSQLATVSFVGTDNLVGEVGKAGDGVLISQVVPFPADDNAAVAKECRDVIARHAGGAKLGFVNFEGCLTARVLVGALDRAGKTPTRAALVAAMDGMKGVDLGGVTLNLAADNHQAMNQVFLTQIKDGQISKLR
ncbi:ABC transporter substrate-binding protein [Aquabacterium sp.]|uniref:ABC transporter substrate-binding protein n=1 Tax=Aquabacterium sp. TaxID=1872578 RepID=UPI002C73DE1A|nr:ABC transporter substrate-binding protein [Aquabacterium sp.]HSW06029.1 ABC transporter substrate-binding protein [Aquabacterium sp.]